MHLFVDNLTNLDFSYLDSTRGLVGETWLASIALEGSLDEQGMICDFGIVKRMLRDWLDEFIDHRLLVPTASSALVAHHEIHGNISLEWQYASKERIACQSPSQAITLIPINKIEPQSVAAWCIEQLKNQFPTSVSQLTLTFEAESIDGPYYHYSHGLKKHGGNCQRIAHGHRSRIEIWRNGVLDIETMKNWANVWRDIYIGTASDLIEQNDNDNFHFAYRAQQGDFVLELPRNACYVITTDSTVEFIAQHIADTLKAKFPKDNFKVKAFEGLNKGAIVEI